MSDGRVTYLRWLAKEHPKLYRETAAKVFANPPAKLAGLGWINLVVQAVATVGSAVLQKKQQDKALALQKKTVALEAAQMEKDRAAQIQFQLLEINTKRAAQGLGPVDITGKLVSPATLPLPSGLQKLTNAADSTTLWILAGGAAIFAAFMVFGPARKPSR